jgi:hypothetical protein
LDKPLENSKIWQNYQRIGGILFIPPLPEGGEEYTVLPLSFRPSKIFFITFFSVTVDGRNLGYNKTVYIPPI